MDLAVKGRRRIFMRRVDGKLAGEGKACGFTCTRMVHSRENYLSSFRRLEDKAFWPCTPD